MKIIAHRGASGEFPENSLLAFEQAIIQGADGIELDVHYHQSQEFIVLHDAYLDKTTDGSGHYSNYSLDYLTSLSLGSEQYLTTLSQALALISGRVIVNIEVKSSSDKQHSYREQLNSLSNAICHAKERNGFNSNQFIISSFDHELLSMCNRELSGIKIAALIAHLPLNLSGTLNNLPYISVNPDIDCLNEKLVKQIHDLGMEVWVYTVDKADDLRRCDKYQVDAIFTNLPLKSRIILENHLV